MDEIKDLKILLTKMEYHLEEQITFVNEICSENFIAYDDETICFYLTLRELFRKYKKEIKKLIAALEYRKDNL